LLLLTGGGCKTDAIEATSRFSEAYPISDTSYRCTLLNNDAGDKTVTAYAVCASLAA
jgi:hypothetical protein